VNIGLFYRLVDESPSFTVWLKELVLSNSKESCGGAGNTDGRTRDFNMEGSVS